MLFIPGTIMPTLLNRPSCLIRAATVPALTLLACGIGSRVAAAQPTFVHPDQRPLAEQLAMGYFDVARLAEAIPGFSMLDHLPKCGGVEVFLADTAWADSARALFRHALPPADGSCGSKPRVHVLPAAAPWKELDALGWRVADLLRDAGERHAWAGIHRARVRVTASTRPAVERVRTLLAAAPEIPAALVEVALVDGRLEVDGPVTPPAEVVLLVLDSAVTRLAREAHGPVLVADTLLPTELDDDALQELGLARRPSTEAFGRTSIRVMDVRQYENGEYAVHVLAVACPERQWEPRVGFLTNGWVYQVRRGADGWRVAYSLPDGGDAIVICSQPTS